MAAPAQQKPVDFGYLKDSLIADAELREQIREAVRDVESAERSCLAVINRVHSVGRDQSAFSLRCDALVLG